MNQNTVKPAKVLVSFGTRPEAIKMCPVIAALRDTNALEVRVAVTAQHRELLDQVLGLWGITPDADLDLMLPHQSLDALASRILTRFGELLDIERPQRVLVHGDTLTTMMVALACYFRRIPVGHVEAGLRSGDIYAPWPEEVNRQVAGTIADLHFAPTEAAAAALRREDVAPGTIHVTGNTVIDALLQMREKLAVNPALAAQLDPLLSRFAGKRIIAITAHRRESFGNGMAEIAAALKAIAARGDVGIIYPLHPNPAVAAVMRQALGSDDAIALTDPLDYPCFVRLLESCEIVLTDSGGVQEEAPSLGKPVLVLRETTERPEGIEAGTARLIGTNSTRIIAEVERLLTDPSARLAMAQVHNPYGDGMAAARIAEIVVRTQAETRSPSPDALNISA